MSVLGGEGWLCHGLDKTFANASLDKQEKVGKSQNSHLGEGPFKAAVS